MVVEAGLHCWGWRLMMMTGDWWRQGCCSWSLVTVGLHQTMNLEPVWSSSISWSWFTHSHHQTFSQSTSFARSSVLLVHHTPIVVLALCYHWLVVAGSSKEWFASLTSECSKMESCCWLVTHSTQLVLHRVHLVELKTEELTHNVHQWIRFQSQQF